MDKTYADTDALILCGGLGTRFRSVSSDIPKALALIQDKPFVDLLLDTLLTQGFRRIVLATGYLGNQVANHIEQRNDAEYIISQEPVPLGTGGAIKHAESHLRSDLVLILNGDSYIDMSLHALLTFHHHHQADMTLTLSSVTLGKDYGNVLLSEDQQVTGFSEKSDEIKTNLINAGVYCLKRSLLSHMRSKKVFSLETDCIPYWVLSHKVFGMVVDREIYDIGTPERYKLFKNKL